MEIINRTGHRVVESNLCYPLDSGYRMLCKLDAEFVRYELLREFAAERINNKYAVVMSNGQIWYQHDDNTWVIDKKESKNQEVRMLDGRSAIMELVKEYAYGKLFYCQERLYVTDKKNVAVEELDVITNLIRVL